MIQLIHVILIAWIWCVFHMYLCDFAIVNLRNVYTDLNDDTDSDFASDNDTDITHNGSIMQASVSHQDNSHLGIYTTVLNDTIETRLLLDEENENSTKPIHNGQITNASDIVDDKYSSSNSDSDSDSDDTGPSTLSGKIMHWFTMPLQILFKLTCPPAGEGIMIYLHSKRKHVSISNPFC